MTHIKERYAPFASIGKQCNGDVLFCSVRSQLSGFKIRISYRRFKPPYQSACLRRSSNTGSFKFHRNTSKPPAESSSLTAPVAAFFAAAAQSDATAAADRSRGRAPQPANKAAKAKGQNTAGSQPVIAHTTSMPVRPQSATPASTPAHPVPQGAGHPSRSSSASASRGTSHQLAAKHRQNGSNKPPAAPAASTAAPAPAQSGGLDRAALQSAISRVLQSPSVLGQIVAEYESILSSSPSTRR